MKIDTAAILAEVRANRARLEGCKRHRFEPPALVKLGLKLTCSACGGEMHLTDISYYIAGYEAAGGLADDVWPGYRK